ncbi:hypothetical protein Aperf_G00000132548 [Anoplocephala perfoliata]
MDPIFEPIFDPVENMEGYPFTFSKPKSPRDEMVFEPFESDIFDMFRNIFDDDEFRVPFRTRLGYIAPLNPRRDYILDDEDDQPKSSLSFSRSFCSSSSFSSDSNSTQYATIKTSIKQPDGTKIFKEVTRQNGQEVVVTRTTYPDGRVESTTETRGNVLNANASPAVKSDYSTQGGGFFSNIRRWFKGD